MLLRQHIRFHSSQIGRLRATARITAISLSALSPKGLKLSCSNAYRQQWLQSARSTYCDIMQCLGAFFQAVYSRPLPLTSTAPCYLNNRLLEGGCIGYSTDYVSPHRNWRICVQLPFCFCLRCLHALKRVRYGSMFMNTIGCARQCVCVLRHVRACSRDQPASYGSQACLIRETSTRVRE